MDELEVDVAALFDKENQVSPLSVVIDGQEYGLKVRGRTAGETLKKRGSGIRYDVVVAGEDFSRLTWLFRIGDQWFLADQSDDSIPDIQTRHRGFCYGGKKLIDGRYDNPYKVAVDVAAMCGFGSGVAPYAFWWEDGREYAVDRVLEQEPAASLKAGIIGIRYKISVLGRETFLFRDDDLWYMERRKQCRVLDVHGTPIS